MVDVYEAVTSRRAVRGFTDKEVPREVLERVLSAAAWAPSGSNIQPWNIYVVTGAPLAELKKRAVGRVANSVLWDEREYVMYPPAMKSPYRDRRSAFGHERYSALGIAREDWEARQRAAIANWDCFGARCPVRCSARGRTRIGDRKRSCCCCVRRGSTAVHRWRGHRSTRRSRISCHPHTSSCCSVACRSATRTSR